MITTKQAIDALKKRISPYTNCAADAEANEVIKMAITALKQGNVIDKIRSEIKENRDDWIKGQDTEWNVYDRCLWIIDKYTKSEGEK